MTGFYLSLSDDQIANQIAMLLNNYNRLTKLHNNNTIKYNKAKYFIELHGDLVIACAGLTQTGLEISKIHHIAVRPEFRKQGLGRKLVTVALNHCVTSHVFMTIRDDNIPSLKLARSLGFSMLNYIWREDHYILIVGRSIR